MRAPAGPRPSVRLVLAAVLATVLGAAPRPASAQSTLVVEARGGVAIPTGSFSTGPGGGRLAEAPAVGVQFQLLRGARTYLTLGFAQVRVDCSRDGCPSRWVATQWDAGVRVELAPGTVVPWIRAGVVSPTVERVPRLDGSGAPLRPGTSDRGWGGEAGAGVRVAVSERLSLSPGARFVAVDVGRGGDASLRMRYVVADLGLVVGF